MTDVLRRERKKEIKAERKKERKRQKERQKEAERERERKKERCTPSTPVPHSFSLVNGTCTMLTESGGMGYRYRCITTCQGEKKGQRLLTDSQSSQSFPQ